MRHPRLTPPLALVAHGSADPRFAAVVEAVAARVAARRPGLDVRVGYLEHGPPGVTDAAPEGAVVVPLLLAAGYHVRVDLPAQAPGRVVTEPVGPDRRLAAALADRLAEAGWDGTTPVTLAAAGSSDERALADVRLAAAWLGELIGVPVSAAFVSAGEPRVAAAGARVLAAYLVAPGGFHDVLRRTGAAVVTAPIGDHAAVADVVLDRYDAAQVPGRTAPA